MKAEAEPIAADEWLLRVVVDDRFTDDVPVISPGAFKPRDRKSRSPDVDGISLFRKDCLADPAELIARQPADKRGRLGVVAVRVSDVLALGLTVAAKPDPDIPGHVVVPELCTDAFPGDRGRLKLILLELATIASNHILIRPTGG